MVVLGDTGRNFGAGMSGGVAYVYNADGQFERDLNTELVELESLDEADLEFVHGAVTKHYDYTDSAVAARVLANWPRERQLFAKVMPRDYKRVLTAIKRAELDGRNIDDAVMEAARG